MLKFNPTSCDQAREEALEALKHLDPGLDAIRAQCNYFQKVDDRSTVNNHCDLLMDVTRDCKKMANARLWMPIHPQVNFDKLLDDLGFDWPKSKTLNDIEEEFEKKGLRSSKVLMVPQAKRAQQTSKAPKSSKPREETDTEGVEETFDNPILNDPRLKNIDKKIAERILNEVVHQKTETQWDDIAGLDNVKQAITEIVVYPMQNPQLFQGLLAPAKGLLLFGPPGTGKTLIGKCIASESGATFFAISASSLTSKWVGEGEKMVRALFAVARCMQPSVVFIDEIDSLLTHRVDGEHDSTRKMKTEFLVQFDGVSTGSDDQLLVIGATNRPHELDEAARRRFTKRLYIPLPENQARQQIITRMMAKGKSDLSEDCINIIVEKTSGFSGADMSTLCREAALSAVRTLIRARGGAKNLGNNDLPPITLKDFEDALKFVKSSVGASDLAIYEEWDRQYGSSANI